MQKSSVFLVRVQCRRKESTFAISSTEEFVVLLARCSFRQWVSDFYSTIYEKYTKKFGLKMQIMLCT